jgi:uncharacterized protein YqeY
VLSAYKPAGLSTEEIAAIIDAAVIGHRRQRPADMGKLMAVLKPHWPARPTWPRSPNW